MATVRVEDHTLVIELKRSEVLWACHSSFRIPLEHVKGAGTAKPPSFWESLKLIGTGAGKLKMAGTFLYHGEVVFFDYAGDENVLVIDLIENNYKHLFVHIDPPDTPQAAAARIQQQLAAAS